MKGREDDFVKEVPKNGKFSILDDFCALYDNRPPDLGGGGGGMVCISLSALIPVKEKLAKDFYIKSKMCGEFRMH